ncbi:MAG: hypothetical protein AB7U75_12865 [Hyphomicrobiaceae bacterium]
MIKLNMCAEVYLAGVNLNDWVVRSVEPDEEGRIFEAIFSGHDAEARALEYAAAKYVEFRRHVPALRQGHCDRTPNENVFRSSSNGTILCLVSSR